MSLKSIFLIALALTSSAILANPLIFLKDIDTKPENSFPRFFFDHNGVIFFRADDKVVGDELWRTDGTADGTWLVKDIYEGEKDGVRLGQGAASVGTNFFFQGRTALEGNELWKTDGTTEGTVLVKDIHPGGYDQDEGAPNIDILGKLGTEVYFAADNGLNGRELWKSDGTEIGTQMVKNIYLDLGPNTIIGSNPEEAIELGGKLYFSALDEVNGRELWVTDGTEVGTTLVKDIANFATDSNPNNLIAYNGNLIFAAQDDDNGNELWISDGTGPGTQMLSDINDSAEDASSDPQHFVEYNGDLYFAATTPANGRELWRTDGTNSNTVLVADINTAGSNSQNSSPNEFVVFDNRLFFTAFDGVNGTEIWVTDGSNTSMFTSFDPGTPTSLTTDGNSLYFTAFTADDGAEPWVSDGTQGGTQLLANILPGDLGADPREYHPLVGSNGNVLFGEFNPDGEGAFEAGLFELWITNGTELGTQILKDIATVTSSSSPRRFTNFKNNLFFVADDTNLGQELWRSDGTPEGTFLVRDLAPGIKDGNPGDFAPVGDHMFFYFRDDNILCCNLFLGVTDGTTDGTLSLMEFESVSDFVSLDGSTVFFLAKDLTDDIGIWTSDGTVLGTQQVVDLPSTEFSFEDIKRVGNEFLFYADDAGGDRLIWKSDGTDPGTMPLVDPSPSDNIRPNNFIVFDEKLFFTASDNSTDPALWVSDGTAPGSMIVKGGFNSFDDNTFHVTRDKLFFIADEGDFGNEIWVSDGTTLGTQMVVDLDTEPNDGIDLEESDELVASLDRIYFIYDDGVHGRELWTSDGTAVGTILLKDVNNRPEGSDVDDLTVAGNTLYFEADDDTHGEELWISHGTPATTYLFKDTVPGPSGGDPDDMLLISDLLFMELEDGVHGDEVWVLDLRPVCAAVESVNGNVVPVCF